MKGAGPQILGTGAKFKRVPCQKRCRVNRALDIPCSSPREYIPVYSLYRVLSSPFICSVDAVELKPYARRYLPSSPMKRMKQGEKSKRESSLWVKRKKKRPGPKKQNDSIEEAKKIRLAASFHTT